MNPRRRHRATSLSMSMTYLTTDDSLQPMTLDDSHGTNLDPQRVSPELRNQVELIDLGSRADVFIIAQLAQLDSSLADLERPLKEPAVILETIPGQPSAVVEANFHGLAEEIDERSCQQDVFEGDL